LYGILRKNFGTTVMRSPKSYNSQIGVALSLWQIRAADKFAIIEAGVSGKGEMSALKKMIGRVNIGIFTNLYAAHDGGFNDRNEKFSEKWFLFDADSVVICSENLIKNFPDSTAVRSIKTYGTESKELKIIENYLSENNRIVEAIFNDKKIKLTIPFTDEAAFQNAVLCFMAAAELGIEPEKIIESIVLFEPIEMRLSLKTGDNNCIIIDDAYSNDINSLAVALDYMTQQSGNHSRTVILSDILESNELDEHLYKKVAELLTEKNVSKIIGIGNKIKILKRYLNTDAHLEFIGTKSTRNNFRNKFIRAHS
jgi:UDP-N-acetylmuramyl pentapeptide synthase